MEWVAAVLGLVVGGVLGWISGVARIRTALQETIRDLQVRAVAAETAASELRNQIALARAKADSLDAALLQAESAKAGEQARIEEMQRSISEQRATLQEAREKLSETFRALASEVLRISNEDFLKLAAERLATLQRETQAGLTNAQTAIAGIVDPVKESLNKVDRQLQAIEGTRREAYGQLKEQVSSLAEAHRLLRAETANLVAALKSPIVRGRWGEVQLRRVVELAGMQEYCDFSEQFGIGSENGVLRPDMVINLTGGRQIAVDAKTSLQAYLDALEATSEEVRTAKLKEHAQQVRARVAELSAKNYADRLERSVEFVVLFIPGEVFFSAALREVPELIEESANKGIILASPTTLLALLKAVAYGWREQRLAENAMRISELGRELHERLAKMIEHLMRLGQCLGKSVEVYNSTIGSFNSRVMPSAEQLGAMGAGGTKQLSILDPIDERPRLVRGPEETEPSL